MINRSFADLDKVLAHPLHHLLTVQNHLSSLLQQKHHIQFSFLSSFDYWRKMEWLCHIFDSLESPIQGIDNSTSRGHYACCKSCESIKKKGMRREYPDFYLLLTPLHLSGDSIAFNTCPLNPLETNVKIDYVTFRVKRLCSTAISCLI